MCLLALGVQQVMSLDYDNSLSLFGHIRRQQHADDLIP